MSSVVLLSHKEALLLVSFFTRTCLVTSKVVWAKDLTQIVANYCLSIFFVGDESAIKRKISDVITLSSNNLTATHGTKYNYPITCFISPYIKSYGNYYLKLKINNFSAVSRRRMPIGIHCKKQSEYSEHYLKTDLGIVFFYNYTNTTKQLINYILNGKDYSSKIECELKLEDIIQIYFTFFKNNISLKCIINDEIIINSFEEKYLNLAQKLDYFNHFHKNVIKFGIRLWGKGESVTIMDYNQT